MKKWLLTLYVSMSLLMPMTASANELSALCRSASDFAGGILDARKAGVHNTDALNVVEQITAGLNGSEKQIFGNLLRGMVGIVYSLPSSQVHFKHKTDSDTFRRNFVNSLHVECIRQNS
ncbi:hypothetical protein ADP71_22550 [Vitreoscilla sp. C1]|uniref:hypothetical protein n=1 Tax=Vitreoscilla sp. (strain C1) TaxID=96942 RepID=UPI000CDCA3C4|nr:hypothetical protein [Vitreoscilla sp. C1]AUZ05643.1 hypothetical protein ADP71_22550 [Vitreoscilla sp. C1]